VGLVTGGVSRLSANATGVVAIPGTGTSYFQVDASGDVRIGNLAPTNSLRYLDIANTDTGTGSGAVIRLITQNSAGTSSVSADIVKYRNGAFYINNNETNASTGVIIFTTGGTERMRIAANGRATFRPNSEAFAVGAAFSPTSGVVYFGARNESATPDAVISNAGGGPLMTVQNGGNVGIGTTSPSQKLDVNGNVRVSGNISRTGASAATDLGLYSETASNWIRLACNSGDIRFFVDAAAGNQFQGGTAAATLTSAGNFGIGRNDPSYKLDVRADALLGATAGDSVSISRLTGIAENNLHLQTKLHRISNGTAWTTTALRVQASVEATPFGYIDYLNGGSASIAFGQSTSEFMRIDITGNVGIGTTTPSQKLDVVGSVNVSGTLQLSGSTSGFVAFQAPAAPTSHTYTLPAVTGTSGQVLTTNGAGVLSWTTDSRPTKTLATFTAEDNYPPATNYATLDTRNSVLVLDFDATTEESATFIGVIPENAALTNGLTVRLWWMGDTATTGNVRWGVQFEDTGTDLDADSYDTNAQVTSAVNATSGIESVASITITTIDALAAGDRFRLRVYRVAADATNDTMAGDAQLVAVEVRAA
jgi:hypothetical protein